MTRTSEPPSPLPPGSPSAPSSAPSSPKTSRWLPACCEPGPARLLSFLMFGTPLTDPVPKPVHAPHTVDKHLLVNGESATFTDYFEICEVVGRGAFGTISVARNKQYGHERALKVTRCSASLAGSLDKEVAIHSLLDHPHIIRLYETYESKGRHHVVMELCRGGTVEDILKDRPMPFSEAEARHMFCQMLRGIQYLHTQSIAHRDIKLPNLLLKEDKADLTEGTVKLIDFGFARRFTPEEGMKTVCGSPAYMAPEILLKERPYAAKCDVFSSGVLLFRMLTKQHPFEGNSVKEMLESIKNRPPLFDESDWAALSPDVRDLVERTLCKEPKDRPSAEEVLDCLLFSDSPASLATRKFGRTVTPKIATEMLHNCMKFSEKSPFHQIAMTYAAYNLDDRQLGGLPEAFLAMNRNGDGKLTLEDLRQFMVDMLPADMDREEFNDLFEKMDVDGSGSVEYTEFLAATMRPLDSLSKGMKEACAAAFKTLDIDGTGSISIPELRESLLQHQTSGEIARAFQDVDTNGDGTIDLEEFENMLRRRTLSQLPSDHDGFFGTPQSRRNGSNKSVENLVVGEDLPPASSRSSRSSISSVASLLSMRLDVGRITSISTLTTSMSIPQNVSGLNTPEEGAEGTLHLVLPAGAAETSRRRGRRGSRMPRSVTLLGVAPCGAGQASARAAVAVGGGGAGVGSGSDASSSDDDDDDDEGESKEDGGEVPPWPSSRAR